MKNFTDIDYLKNGHSKQRNAYDVLVKHQIMVSLREFDPILAGTIPLQINIENSDLDILCHWTNKLQFIDSVVQQFGTFHEFKIRESNHYNSVIANFKADRFEIEVFGQNIPTRMQNGYKHMLIEDQILEKYGEEFRLQVIELKKQGYKTEPAFALLLGLEGNPFEALLRYDMQV